MMGARKAAPFRIEDSARGRILASAATLFRIRGFERTTVRDLATDVGMQSGSIFHHFKTKEEILSCVMEDTIHFNLSQLKTAAAESETTIDKLRALIRSELVSFVGETGSAMIVIIHEWRCLTPNSQTYLLGLRQSYEKVWRDVLVQAQHESIISPRRDLTVLRRFLLGALSSSNHWYKADGKLNIESLVDQAYFLIAQ